MFNTFGESDINDKEEYRVLYKKKKNYLRLLVNRRFPLDEIKEEKINIFKSDVASQLWLTIGTVERLTKYFVIGRFIYKLSINVKNGRFERCKIAAKNK